MCRVFVKTHKTGNNARLVVTDLEEKGKTTTWVNMEMDYSQARKVLNTIHNTIVSVVHCSILLSNSAHPFGEQDLLFIVNSLF